MDGLGERGPESFRTMVGRSGLEAGTDDEETPELSVGEDDNRGAI